MADGRRKYKRDPIAEAICEFQFISSADWDLTIPGRLYNEVKDSYPGKPINQTAAEIELNPSEPTSPVRLKHGVARVQLPSADGSRIVGVGPNQLSIHVRRPYSPGWESDFRPRIVSALQAYRRITNPKAVKRVGLRYLNHIVIPQKPLDLDAYFRVAPRDVEGLPTLMRNFLTRTETEYPDATKLLTTFSGAEAPEGSVGFLLDLDTVWLASEVALDEAVDKADDLHSREETAFEAMITDKVREVLDGD